MSDQSEPSRTSSCEALAVEPVEVDHWPLKIGAALQAEGDVVQQIISFAKENPTYGPMMTYGSFRILWVFPTSQMLQQSLHPKSIPPSHVSSTRRSFPPSQGFFSTTAVKRRWSHRSGGGLGRQKLTSLYVRTEGQDRGERGRCLDVLSLRNPRLTSWWKRPTRNR